MGVPKSRKSIRFTKYSLKSSPFNKILYRKKLNIFFEKDKLKKTRIFFLRKREDDSSIFYNAKS